MLSINMENKFTMKISSLHIYKSIPDTENNVYVLVSKYGTVAVTHQVQQGSKSLIQGLQHWKL